MGKLCSGVFLRQLAKQSQRWSRETQEVLKVKPLVPPIVFFGQKHPLVEAYRALRVSLLGNERLLWTKFKVNNVKLKPGDGFLREPAGTFTNQQ